MSTLLFVLAFLLLFIMIIGIVSPKYFEKIFKKKVSRLKMTIIFIVALIIFTALSSIDYSNKENTFSLESISVNGAVDYSIVKTEDMSRKAMGNKNIEDFTSSELSNLPNNKKVKYFAVINSVIDQDIAKSTANKIILDIIVNDKDVDEIILWLYSDKDLIDSGAYDIGSVIFAPLGDLGNVNSEIALNNDKSSYKISYDIKSNLEEYLKSRNEQEEKFGFNVEERKQIFKDIVSAQDKARAEADKKYPVDDYLTNYENNSNEYKRLADIYEKEVLEKWNISSEQKTEISREAQIKNWPLE
ncbi:MAG: hypothetical protein EOM88_01830 [Clostridia bacterium]|nr:hypothetical protein [Clostridia bacterium]